MITKTIHEETNENQLFFAYLGADKKKNPPPLGFFRQFLVESDVPLVVRKSDLDQRGLEEYGTKFPVQFLTNEQFSAYINRYDKAFFL